MRHIHEWREPVLFAVATPDAADYVCLSYGKRSTQPATRERLHVLWCSQVAIPFGHKMYTTHKRQILPLRKITTWGIKSAHACNNNNYIQLS